MPYHTDNQNDWWYDWYHRDCDRMEWSDEKKALNDHENATRPGVLYQEKFVWLEAQGGSVRLEE